MKSHHCEDRNRNVGPDGVEILRVSHVQTKKGTISERYTEESTNRSYVTVSMGLAVLAEFGVDKYCKCVKYASMPFGSKCL